MSSLWTLNCNLFVVPDPLLPKSTEVHYPCLDLFPVKWEPKGIDEQSSESGILVEIWATGGVFHTSLPWPEGSLVELSPAGHVIQAQVDSCQQEDGFGFLVSVSVQPEQHEQWFPQSYCPPQLDKGEDQEPFQGIVLGENW